MNRSSIDGFIVGATSMAVIALLTAGVFKLLNTYTSKLESLENTIARQEQRCEDLIVRHLGVDPVEAWSICWMEE